MSNTPNNAMRPVPPPPGGGSWRFDDALWDWVANDPVPAAAPAPEATGDAPSITEE